jgi:predicted dinucleotide-utilizing enzyme
MLLGCSSFHLENISRIRYCVNVVDKLGQNSFELETSPYITLEEIRAAIKAFPPIVRKTPVLPFAYTGAFVDDQLPSRLRKTAKRCGSQLVLSSGALRHKDDLPLETLEPIVLFRGSAREAATRYPLNANVTIVSALASVGVDRTVVELVSNPSVVGNRHEIHASGDFGSLDLVLFVI